MEKLKTEQRVAGIKQAKTAITRGEADRVYLADDADFMLKDEIVELCAKAGIEPITGISLKELGRACGIEVPCAVAAVLKSKNL